MITLAQWRTAEERIDAEQIPDSRCLLDRLPIEFIESLSPLEALAITHDPTAYLRPKQIVPSDPDWLVVLYLAGRGFGKSFAGAGWIIDQVLHGTPDQPQDFALVAPTIEDCWTLQWRVIKALIPPWVRYLERVNRQCVIFPDHGVTLFLHSAEAGAQYRGPNLRGCWIEEPVKFARGEELWRNLRLALRVPGELPPRAVITTTPPREIDWILALATEPTTRTIRGAMRDNPALDQRAIDAAYASMAGSIEGDRELDGKVVLGSDGALFKLEDIEAARVHVAPLHFDQVVVAVDPSQSNKKDADPTGLVCVGSRGGHVFVLASESKKLEPVEWATLAIQWAERYHAGQYIVEPTGSGGYPRATLDAQMRIARVQMRPIVESPARGSKADRAQPLSAACAGGRLHLVGRHEALERDLTQWHPGAGWSPGGLDALVHGAAAITNNWRR